MNKSFGLWLRDDWDLHGTKGTFKCVFTYRNDVRSEHWVVHSITGWLHYSCQSRLSLSPSLLLNLFFCLFLYIYIYSLIRWLSFASWWIVCSAMSPPPPLLPPLFLSLFLSLFLFWFILTNWIHLADFMYIYIYIHISVLWFVFFKRLLFNISSEFPATALRRCRNASPMKWMGWVPILTVICTSLHSMVSDGRSDTAAAFLHHNSPASQNEFCLKIASASCMQWAIARWMTPASSSTYKINLNQ